jgi:hypothetical protein
MNLMRVLIAFGICLAVGAGASAGWHRKVAQRKSGHECGHNQYPGKQHTEGMCNLDH